MFIGNLKTFQEEHIDSLLRKYADFPQVVLNAPTGSGKTVMATKFICEYLAENPNTVFLWLCPGAGALQIQSQKSFEKFTYGLDDGDVYDFIKEDSPQGKVYFINWDKLNREDNIVNRNGERVNLQDKIEYCRQNSIPIFVVIDEEHKNQKFAIDFVDWVKPVHVLRISATPLSEYEQEIITDQEVIAEGLIATGISINEGLEEAVEENNFEDDDLLLLELADQKRKAILDEYQRLGLNIRPLVLIQFPNGSDEWINRVRAKLADMGYEANSGLVTQWFSGKHPENEEEITKLNGEYAFLLFKQAVATGWDCPRAKILVKLREGGTEAFNIQTIGRIRRMPQRKHYGIELLDRCYVYTLDSRFNEGLKREIGSSFYVKGYSKKNVEGVTLKSEFFVNEQDRYVLDDKKVIEVIRKRMLRDFDLNANGRLEPNELREYVFGTELKAEALVGVARTTRDIQSLNKVFAGAHEINTKTDGFIIQDARRKIAAAGHLPEEVGKKVLKTLFGPMPKTLPGFEEDDDAFEMENKLLEGMSMRSYDAFLVNNRERLMAIFADTNAREYIEMTEAEVKEDDWTIPDMQEYKYDRTIQGEPCDQNIFEGYDTSILVQPNRFVTEIAFEQWCEKASSNVEWVYKNGDKGDMYFHIIYRMANGRAYFYPDYIVKLRNGDIWIIEAKGGRKLDGTSNNVDTYAERKFLAMKEYASRHPEIKWCFARAIGPANIVVSNTIWDENVNNNEVWKPIREVVK